MVYQEEALPRSKQSQEWDGSLPEGGTTRGVAQVRGTTSRRKWFRGIESNGQTFF
jgi:hypothetical protein